MKDKKLSDLTIGDVARFMLLGLVGFVILYGILLLIGWLVNL